MKTDDDASPNPQKVGLVRNLGLFDITMVGVGAMIGAGIFVLTGIAAGTAGPALILSFALNGVVTVFTAMVYAELGSAIPEAGGGYLWVKEGLPAWNAFLAGWMSWFAHAVAGSLYALGFGAYFELVLTDLGVSVFGLSGAPLQKLLSVLIALLFIGINFKGVSETGKVGNVVTMGKILILGIFIASGLVTIFRHPSDLDKFTPFAPEGLTGVLTAMGLTFIAFEGYEIIVQAGEEVKNPKRNIPKAVFLSLAIVIPIYILVAVAAIGAVDTGSAQPTWKWLGVHAELGLVEAARQFMPFGTPLLLLAGLLSTMSALNATTFSSTRVSFAMGRDRNLPDFFSRIHSRTRTPHVALLWSGALIIFMAVVIPIQDVAAATDVMFLLLFLQVNVAVITIRKKYGDKLDYGYLMPFFPIVPVIGIVTKLFLALFMFHYSALAWYFVIGWLAVGLSLYYGYASRREKEKELSPVVLEERWMKETDRFRVLVPIADPRSIDRISEVVRRMVQPLGGEVLLLHVIALPAQTPLEAGRQFLAASRPLIDAWGERLGEMGIDFQTLVRVSHRPVKGILDTVAERKVDFVVMGWRGRSRDPHTRIDGAIDLVARQAPCNVVIVQRNVQIPASQILIPVSHPRNAGLLLALGRRLLDDGPESRISILHVVPPGLGTEERESRAESIRRALQKSPIGGWEAGGEPLDDRRISLVVEDARDPIHVISEESRQANLLVIGSSEQSWLGRKGLRKRHDLIARRAACPIVLVNQETHPLKFGIQTFFQFFREAEEFEASSEAR